MYRPMWCNIQCIVQVQLQTHIIISERSWSKQKQIVLISNDIIVLEVNFFLISYVLSRLKTPLWVIFNIERQLFLSVSLASLVESTSVWELFYRLLLRYVLHDIFLAVVRMNVIISFKVITFMKSFIQKRNHY